MGRWVGTIRGSERVLLWVRIDNEDSDHATWSQRTSFVLDLDDGGSLEVDVRGRDFALEPIHSRDGRFSDMVDLPGVDAFGERGPSPHERVTFRYALAQGGDRVTVFGTVTDEQFSEGASHRTAPERRPSRVTARRVVHGDAPGQTATAKPPFSRVAIATIALGSFFIGLAVLGHLTDRLPLRATGVDLGLSMFLIAWAGQLRLNHPLQFIHEEDFVGLRGSGPVFAAVPIVLIGLGGQVVWDQAFTDEPNAVYAVIVFAAVLLNAGWVWLFALATTGTTTRLARQILGAPPLAGRGAFGRIVGTVDDRTPLEDGSAMKAERSEHRTPGIEDDIVAERLAVEQQDGFDVRTSEGASVHVDPRRSTWATTARRFGGAEPEPQFEGARRVRAGTTSALSTELIPQGASIVVAGRLADGGVMAASGPHPLLMFAAPPGADVIGVLRRLRLQRPLLLLGVPVFTLGIVAVHLLLAGELPDFSILAE